MIIVIYYETPNRDRIFEIVEKLGLKRYEGQLTQDDDMRGILPVYGEKWQAERLGSISEIQLIGIINE